MSSLRSDNGTNFVGANKELKRSLVELNNVKIQGALIQDGIKWSFNTPAASHQGGVWERLIRSVRRILISVLGQQVLNDEGLQTLFCEANPSFHQDSLSRVTSTSEEDGSKYSIWQSCSGKGGLPNIYLLCKKDKNGPIQEETSLKEILSSLLTLQPQEDPG